MASQLQLVQQGIEQLVAQLQHEGILDEQFTQLMQLQDDSNPDFVAEVVQLYFEDSVQKLDKIGAMLSNGATDFNELDQLVHQLKGSSASLGAQMIAQYCIKLRSCCQGQDQQGCQVLLGSMREAYQLLRSKLETFMQLEAQRKHLMSSSF